MRELLKLWLVGIKHLTHWQPYDEFAFGMNQLLSEQLYIIDLIISLINETELIYTMKKMFEMSKTDKDTKWSK